MTGDRSPIFDCRDVTVRYGSVVALSDVGVAFERGLIVDEQAAGAGADEDLDSRGPRRLLQNLEIVAGCPDVETEVDDRPGGGPLELVVESFERRRRRIGVRHLQIGGDAPLGAGPASGVEIFLVLHARFPEMHLIVDDPGEQVQAGPVDRFLDGGRRRGINLCDPLVNDQH